jgi:exodeoxyribonuclease VII large subunit
VNSYTRMLQQQSTFMVRNEKGMLNNIEKNIANLSLQSVLKRGFSITLKDGRSVKSSSALKAGDVIQTIVADGSITSIVQSANKPDTP